MVKLKINGQDQAWDGDPVCRCFGIFEMRPV